MVQILSQKATSSSPTQMRDVGFWLTSRKYGYTFITPVSLHALKFIHF